MSTFNPDAPCRVHDRLNDKTFDWRQEWAGHYRQYAREHDVSVIGWDGLLFIFSLVLNVLLVIALIVTVRLVKRMWP